MLDFGSPGPIVLLSGVLRPSGIKIQIQILYDVCAILYVNRIVICDNTFSVTLTTLTVYTVNVFDISPLRSWSWLVRRGFRIEYIRVHD